MVQSLQVLSYNVTDIVTFGLWNICDGSLFLMKNTLESWPYSQETTPTEIWSNFSPLLNLVFED